MRTTVSELSPAGTAETVGNGFSRPFGTSHLSLPNPGLTSWAKFRRPCGTELGTVVLTQTLKPSFVIARRGTAEAVPFVQSVFPQLVKPNFVWALRHTKVVP